MENGAEQHMDIIQDTFLRIQDVFFQSPDWRANLKDLHETNVEFRSIAYESASMSIALQDLKQENQLANWLAFLNEVAHAHATQVHVGLGWALAQQLQNPTTYFPLLHPLLRYRVCDGYGYYEGIFRRRRSIINHLKIDLADATASAAIDQGIGRSLWYINKADFAAANAMIETFAPERHANLGRGLGIAIAYVGGCTETMLNEFFVEASTFRKQLATGAAMALISRQYAGYVSAGTELACKVWCGKSATEIAELNTTIRAAINTDGEDAYAKWLHQLEVSF